MTPNYRIDFAGTDATEAMRPFFSSIEVTDADGTELDTATITLADDSRIEIPQEGTACKIYLGFGNELFEVFSGEINHIGVNSPPDKLFLKATGLALSDEKRLQSSQTRSWNEKTLGEIAENIIQSAGFKARVHDRLSGIELKRFMQTVETDIEILEKLADHYGGFLKSDGETIAILPEESRESATGQPLPEIVINRENDKFSNWGWDRSLRKFAGTITATYQADGKTEILERGAGAPTRQLKTIYSSESEAKAAIDAYLVRFKRQEQVTVTMPGRDVAVGSTLKLEGFRAEGEFWITRANHSFTEDGYTVRIEAEK